MEKQSHLQNRTTVSSTLMKDSKHERKFGREIRDAE
jgi:hypothetical protein